MLNIPESIKELFLKDGIRKNFRVHFLDMNIPDLTNDNIVKGSVKFTESACSQDKFKFGLCEASQIEFDCYDLENVKKKTIQCFIEIDISSLDQNTITQYGKTSSDIPYIYYPLSLGVFRIISCPREDLDVIKNDKIGGNELTKRSITAYGPSYNFDWDMDEFEKNKLIYTNYSENINLFKWMFCNYMQKGWEMFFDPDSDFTQLPNKMIVGGPVFQSVYNTEEQSKYWIKVEYKTEISRISNGVTKPDDIYLKGLYYLKENFNEYDNIKNNFINLIILYNIIAKNNVIQYDENIIYYYSGFSSGSERFSFKNEEDFIDAVLYYIKYGVWSYSTGVDSGINIKHNEILFDEFPVPYGDEFVNILNLPYGIHPHCGFHHVIGLTVSLMNGSENINSYHIPIKDLSPSPAILVNDSRYDSGIEIDISQIDDFDPNSMVEGYLELDGRLGRYNREGFLEFYRPNDQVIDTINKDACISCKYEDTYTKGYDRVTVTYENENGETISTAFQFVKQIPENGIPDDTDELIDYVTDYNPDDYQTYSLGWNYLIQNCKFTASQINGILRTVAKNLKNIRYLPSDIDLVGRPWLEAGDGIIISKHGIKEVTNIYEADLINYNPQQDKYWKINYEKGIIELDYKQYLIDYPNRQDSVSFSFPNVFLNFEGLDDEITNYPIEFIIDEGETGDGLIVYLQVVKVTKKNNVNETLYNNNIVYMSPPLAGTSETINKNILIKTNMSSSYVIRILVGVNFYVNKSYTLPTCRIYMKLPLKVQITQKIIPPEYIQNGLDDVYSTFTDMFIKIDRSSLDRYIWLYNNSENEKSGWFNENNRIANLYVYAFTPLRNDILNFDFHTKCDVKINPKWENPEPSMIYFIIWVTLNAYRIEGDRRILDEDESRPETQLNMSYYLGNKEYGYDNTIIHNLKEGYEYEFIITMDSRYFWKDISDIKVEVSFPKDTHLINDKEYFETIILRRNMNVDYFLEDSFEARGE